MLVHMSEPKFMNDTMPIRRGQAAAGPAMPPERTVKSAERVFDLIEVIGRTSQGLAFPALLDAMAIPKSSLHMLLEAAAARGYVEQDPVSRRWTLGMRVWEGGQAYARQHDVIGHAQEVMREFVATINETIQLARLDGNENVYIAKVDSTHPLRLQSDVGGRLLAHATGLGKVLLAELGDAEVRARFAACGLPGMTGNTLTGFDALLAELAATRARGFGIDNEEYTQGIFCLALPIRTGPGPSSMAISVTVPTLRADLDRLSEALAGLARASREIEGRVGGPPPTPAVARLSDPAEARRAIVRLADSGGYRLSFRI
jgi:DNA-binding IclR family transcriptional regulator